MAKFKYNPDKDVRKTKDAFRGEQSPYWQHLDRQANLSGDKHESGAMEHREPARANPDVLSENDSLYHRPVSKADEFKLEVIKDAIAKLTPKQQQILQLHGYNGYTIKETADELGIDESSVNSSLRQIRTKILQCYHENE